MRDLTKEELALAPDWATHYFIDGRSGDVIYESTDLWWWPSLPRPLKNYTFKDGLKIPIPRNSINIKHYELSDSALDFSSIHGDIAYFYLEEEEGGGLSHPLSISKKDAIAIAMALGVTGGDLL